MTIRSRLDKLEELVYKQRSDNNMIDEAMYQQFEDWVMTDPRAKELIKREFDYCMERDYPRNDPDFYDELEDPAFWELVNETSTAFDDYLKARAN